MNLDKYEFIAHELILEYEFVSDGPNNKIKKIVAFIPQYSDGITYFNLGFGDLNQVTGKVDDFAVSDNKDTEKILATIAAIVLHFTNYFPDHHIYVKGSTPSRTRLYQMGLAAHWDEINLALYVFGLKNDEWTPFRKNVNYEAFLALRKKA